MPLRLQVGLQQKAGLPNYGSLGASCEVEFELDSQLLTRSPDAFQQEVAWAFDACRQAVQTELARNKHALANGLSKAAGSNGHRTNGESARPATASQIRALRIMAERQKFDLGADLQRRFGVTQPEDLDWQQASRLIEEFNQAPNGSGA